MHKFARKSSIAALAAAKQNKYKEITTVFFKDYRNLNDETIRKYAKEIGLDMAQFEKDYSDPKANAMITQDISTGKKVKVRGVPALFINGRLVKNRSVEGMSVMIEQELKK